MNLTEVTVNDYAGCVRARQCSEPFAPSSAGGQRGCNWGVPGHGGHPVNCVTYEQAEQFCRWKQSRLPTWAEWHWAVTGKEGRRFPWGNEAPVAQLCWSGGKKRHGTCKVASFPRGDQVDGIYDLIGNVAEWTTTPTQSSEKKYLAGTSWSEDDPMLADVELVNSDDTNRIWHGYGFRCVGRVDVDHDQADAGTP
ncbi:MAG: SUMF1/EgtB/PvdO family nonheme iron enzyme [Myxococcales bacterium]|nr:SUMF1/EgtB/PvdO family nonheme iron enzyme [Myxococcales bacterium]